MSDTKMIEETTEPGRYLIWCPACDEAHQFAVPPWGYDGNAERPTIGGSILVSAVQWGPGSSFRKSRHDVPEGWKTVCHAFVTEGWWEYLGDCTHAMAGRIVDGVPFRPAMRGQL